MSSVALSHGNVYGELAQLSLEVFGSGAPEPFVWEGGGPPAAQALAFLRGWEPLSADALGIAPLQQHPEGLSYELVSGFYQAISAKTPGTANAYVLKGEIGGETTLALVFRGTDELPGDNFDYADFQEHFAKFEPLENALVEYANDPANGVDRILVTGGSLGGAMADIFMQEPGVVGDQRYEALTFGSPGADLPDRVAADADADPRVLNIAHSQDAIPLAHQSAETLIEGADLGDDAPSALGLLGLAALATDPSLDSLVLLKGLPEEQLLDTVLQPPRTLPGGEVVVAVDVPGPDDETGFGYGLVEHDAFLYLATTNALIDLAETPGSALHATPLGEAIREQAVRAIDAFVPLSAESPPGPIASVELAGLLDGLEALRVDLSNDLDPVIRGIEDAAHQFDRSVDEGIDHAEALVSEFAAAARSVDWDFLNL